MKLTLQVVVAEMLTAEGELRTCRCGNVAAFRVSGTYEDVDGRRTRYGVFMCSQCATDVEDGVDELRMFLDDGMDGVAETR